MEAWRWRQGLLLIAALGFSAGVAGADVALLLLLLVGELLAGEPLWRSTPIDRSLAVLIGVTFLSGLLSEWRQVALTSAVILATTAFVTVRAVVLSKLHGPRFALLFFSAWAIGGVAASLIGLARVGPGLNDRAELPWLGYNALGTTLATALVILLGLTLIGSRTRRFLFTAGFTVAAVSLLLTWSRGGWLGAMLGLGILALRTGVRRLWPVLVAACIVIAGVALGQGPRLSWQVNRIRTIASSADPLNRLAVWAVVPKIVADHPIFGTGLSTFPMVYARHTPTPGLKSPGDAHNVLLNFAVETGLVGLAAVLWFLGTAVSCLVKWYRRSSPQSAERIVSASALGAFVALMGHQMVDGTVARVDLAFGLFALIGLGAAGAVEGEPL